MLPPLEPKELVAVGSNGDMPGNYMALLIAIEGMKFSPCLPTFVDLRDAMFEGARTIFKPSTYRYVHCEMWKGFAKRGLGYGADGGSPEDVQDQTPSFDVPRKSALFLDLDEQLNALLPLL